MFPTRTLTRFRQELGRPAGQSGNFSQISDATLDVDEGSISRRFVRPRSYLGWLNQKILTSAPQSGISLIHDTVIQGLRIQHYKD